MTEDPRARAARRAGRTGQAIARAAFVESRVGPFDRAALDVALTNLFDSIGIDLAALASGLPISNQRRWVPIGPSDVRAEDGSAYPRSTGRVRDIAVSPDGTRAYAATGKGGVWYTDTAGAMWAPVGGWANRTRKTGGMSNAQATGCLLVDFDSGGDVKKDFVMVGSGELAIWNRPARPVIGGVGVLAARGAAQNAGVGGDPWEAEAGLSLMEGLGVFRLARQPGGTVGELGPPGPDRVVAATNAGLFLGTRRAAAGGGTEFGWAAVSGLDTFLAWAPLKPIVTDVLWMPGGADGRIVVAVTKGLEQEGANTAALGSGVAFSDNRGGAWQWVTGLDPGAMAVPAAGRMSLARAGDTDRVYVLGDLQSRAAPTAQNNVPTLWQIPAMSAATPTASTIAGVPLIWPWIGKTQRDYDQCVEVDADAVGAGVDRIYLGGSWFSGAQIASIHCFDISVGPALVPSADISRLGPPPAGDGATTGGLIGNNVHPDVHVLRLAGTGRPRQLWVGCDGGVYMSPQAGRVNTFSSLSGGFASLEINFVANHPTSTHFLAGGAQDNGRNVRTGDQVWETILSGDGGGMAFHPKQSQIILSQYVRSSWDVVPLSLAFDMDRFPGLTDRENDLSAFYSGAATIASAATGRVALGTNRVWLTDDLGTGFPNTWGVLPWPSGPVVADPRPGGSDPPPKQNLGVPNGAPLGPIVAGAGPLGRVLTMKWASTTELLVLFDNGVVRWTQDTATKRWSTKLLAAPAGVGLAPDVLVLAPDPAKTTFTDIAPVPGTQDFYLVTSGDTTVPPGDTCFFFDSASKAFQATDLRRQLPATPPALTGPLDPVLAAVVDPAETTTVYVGTVTGVWKGQRTPGVAAHTWTPMLNGLPPAAVQDLTIWVDPADKTAKPRLLRAAMQSKGVWEVDLSADEPQRTYVRVHLRDDRRRLPTPLANPRKAPGANERVDASPDIMVRPAVPTTPPAWKLPAGGVLKAGNIIGALPYQLWTFQTAFRWIFPSVLADGQWTSAFGDLIMLHRKNLGQPAASIKPEIDKSLWDLVMATRLDAQGHVAVAGDLAVYRAPWQTPASLTAVGNEPDLMERVLFAGPRGTSRVFPEKNIVDVLIHHRDTRPLAAGDAFAILVFRDAPLAATLASADVSAMPKFVADVFDADAANSALPTEPTNWHLVKTAAGGGVHRLPVALDARMPRAVAIEVDLSQPPVKPAHSVMFLAFVGSSVDLGIKTPPPGLPATPTVRDLTTAWPYAAARIVEINTAR